MHSRQQLRGDHHHCILLRAGQKAACCTIPACKSVIVGSTCPCTQAPKGVMMVLREQQLAAWTPSPGRRHARRPCREAIPSPHWPRWPPPHHYRGTEGSPSARDCAAPTGALTNLVTLAPSPGPRIAALARQSVMVSAGAHSCAARASGLTFWCSPEVDAALSTPDVVKYFFCSPGACAKRCSGTSRICRIQTRFTTVKVLSHLSNAGYACLRQILTIFACICSCLLAPHLSDLITLGTRPQAVLKGSPPRDTFVYSCTACAAATIPSIYIMTAYTLLATVLLLTLSAQPLLGQDAPQGEGLLPKY